MGSAIIFNDTGISTTPNPSSGTVPLLLNDSATLTGATATAGGTITFNLYPPSDPTCAGSASYTDVVTVNGPGTYSTSPGFTATTAGTWNWTADYSGDRTTPPRAADAAPRRRRSARRRRRDDDRLGHRDRRPGYLRCRSPERQLQRHRRDHVRPLRAGRRHLRDLDRDAWATPATSGDGDYTSASFTTSAAGTYRWIAHFAGDASNVATDTACNDANESVVVSPATPALTTTASGTVTVGRISTMSLT
jgi:hypothetical protein